MSFTDKHVSKNLVYTLINTQVSNIVRTTLLRNNIDQVRYSQNIETLNN